jgi:cellobiose-specific phosphotransferase system component IIA
MTREEACVNGFHIITRTGKAKNTLMNALDHASEGNYAKCMQLIDQASALLQEASTMQSEFEEKSANAKHIQFVVEYGYHHLMTTLILCDLVSTMAKEKKSDPASLKEMYRWYH